MLAEEFCRIANYFVGIYKAEVNADGSFEYLDHHVDDYPENLEFIDWLLAFDVDSVQARAGYDLRKLVPFNVDEEDD